MPFSDVKAVLYFWARMPSLLNDFDLSALMKPGENKVKRQGFVRTGTKPFMALELLKNSKGTIIRTYRHDLESFGWCLAFHCFKEALTWTEGDYPIVAAKKSHFLLHHRKFRGTKSFKAVSATRSWMRHIRNQLDSDQESDLEEESGEVGLCYDR